MDKKKIDLSVVVPVFNGENTAAELICDLLNAADTNMELIFVDDGSQDRTLEILKQFQKEDSRIRIISLSHGGVSRARNFGMELASGNYLLFVDADDRIEPHYLKKMRKSAAKAGTDLICANWVNETGKEFEEESLGKLAGYPGSAADLLRFLLANRTGCAPWSKVFRRELISERGIRFREELNIAEDYIFLLEYLANAETISWIGQAGYHYVVRSDGANFSLKPDYPEQQRMIARFMYSVADRYIPECSQTVQISDALFSARTMKNLIRMTSIRSDWKEVYLSAAEHIRKISHSTPIRWDSQVMTPADYLTILSASCHLEKLLWIASIFKKDAKKRK